MFRCSLFVRRPGRARISRATARLVTILLLATTLAPAFAQEDPLERGQLALEAGDLVVATAAFEEAFRASPQSAEGAYWLSRVELLRGNTPRAQELAERAAKAAPLQAEYQFWHGETLAAGIESAGSLQRMRMAPRMRDAWLRAVELDPEHLEARMSLVQYYLRAPAIVGGGRDKARAEAEEIARRDALAGHRAKAAVLLAEENFEPAAEEYRRAVAASPDSHELRAELGFLCQRMEDWPCAFDAFRQAVDTDSGYMMGWYQIGRTAVLSGLELEEGAHALLRYLDSAPARGMPSLAWAHVRLAQIYERQELRGEARAQYQAALVLDPSHDEARKGLRSLGPE